MSYEEDFEFDDDDLFSSPRQFVKGATQAVPEPEFNAITHCDACKRAYRVLQHGCDMVYYAPCEHCCAHCSPYAGPDGTCEDDECTYRFNNSVFKRFVPKSPHSGPVSRDNPNCCIYIPPPVVIAPPVAATSSSSSASTAALAEVVAAAAVAAAASASSAPAKPKKTQAAATAASAVPVKKKPPPATVAAAAAAAPSEPEIDTDDPNQGYAVQLTERLPRERVKIKRGTPFENAMDSTEDEGQEEHMNTDTED